MTTWELTVDSDTINTDGQDTRLLDVAAALDLVLAARVHGSGIGWVGSSRRHEGEGESSDDG